MPSQYKCFLRTLIIEPNIRDYFSIIVHTYKKNKQKPEQKKPVIISQAMAEYKGVNFQYAQIKMLCSLVRRIYPCITPVRFQKYH